MKPLLPTLTLMLFVSLATTQTTAQITHTTNGNVDRQAEAVLKRASQKLSAKPIAFQVTITDKDANKKVTSTTKANVLYSNNRYRVEFDNQTLYCDGKTLWHWTKDANEVVITSASNAQADLMNPAALLNNYAKMFRAKYIRKDNDGSAVIDLTPLKSQSYYKIRFLINTGDDIIKSMTMHNYDSSESTYVISNFQSGVSVKDSDFTFATAAHPKTEIIDMR